MKEIGERLKSEREKQQLTLKGVSERAHISVSMLESIEAGHFERIGIPVLIRGFVSAYCAVLGMDPGPLLERHAAAIGHYDRQADSMRQYGRWCRSVRRTAHLRIAAVVVLLVLLLATVLGGALYAKWKGRAQTQDISMTGYPQQELPSDLPSENVLAGRAGREEPTMAFGPPPSDASQMRASKEGACDPASSRTAPESGQTRHPVEGRIPDEVLPLAEAPGTSIVLAKHRLAVEAQERTELRVKLDESKEFQSCQLKKGERKQWEVAERILVEARKASGIRVVWDDRPVEIAPRADGSIRLVLPQAKPPDKGQKR
ncbi:MAG: helix-turn-helix domain-containing protein [Syntrophobacteraceae bacterium]